jgi:hypothetical protein
LLFASSSLALASSDGLRQGQIGIGRHERTSQN